MAMVGLGCAGGADELIGIGLNLVEALTYIMERLVRSGLPSLELPKLVTSDDWFDKWALLIFSESSTPCTELPASTPIRP